MPSLPRLMWSLPGPAWLHRPTPYGKTGFLSVEQAGRLAIGNWELLARCVEQIDRP
jgi:hypothetical protein